MSYTIYNKNTGQILFTSGNKIQTTDTTDFVEGTYFGRDYYIDINAKLPVSMPPLPGAGKYSFDYATKEWQLEPEIVTEGLIRIERDQYLKKIDRVNPIWYDTLTEEQKTELAEYRQALLDITTQAGFPAAVVWPLKPVWL
jgi:hypothetical protein